MTELEHIFQTGSFIEYAKKFGVKDMNGLMDLFEGWASSKDFIEEDKSLILKLTQEYYLEKSKEEEIRKSKKSRKQKNKIIIENDPRQMEFDF